MVQKWIHSEYKLEFKAKESLFTELQSSQQIQYYYIRTKICKKYYVCLFFSKICSIVFNIGNENKSRCECCH